MELTEKDIAKIKYFGALDYGEAEAEDMCALLEWTEEEFIEEWNKESSEFNKIYNKGRIESRFKTNVVLLSMAHDGDLKSLEVLEKRKNKK